MWIIPKSLVCHFALDMKGLEWDSEKLSQICKLSFTQRSKNMSAKYFDATYAQKLNRRWFGVDSSKIAVQLTKKRLLK